jgi:cytochrome bd-type quinol oxidase subunit 2
LEIETMETLLLCFFVGGFVLGSSFGCGVTLWAAMDRANKARKASPESMAMQGAYRD